MPIADLDLALGKVSPRALCLPVMQQKTLDDAEPELVRLANRWSDTVTLYVGGLGADGEHDALARAPTVTGPDGTTGAGAADILMTDINVTNGVIHVVGEVLLLLLLLKARPVLPPSPQQVRRSLHPSGLLLARTRVPAHEAWIIPYERRSFHIGTANHADGTALGSLHRFQPRRTNMETKLWNIDTTHSGISFSVRHMVFAKVRGRFGEWSGSVRLDPSDLTSSSVEATIDAASIDTGVADRDNHLRSADFFDVEQFPKLTFASKKVEKVDDEHYRLLGDLTIRDTTREVTIEVEYAGQAKDPWGNTRAAFNAKTSLTRSDFGLTWNQVLEAGGVLVGERIDIEVEVQAVAPAAEQAA